MFKDLLKKIYEEQDRDALLSKGLGAELNVDDVDREQLLMGINVEFEHSNHGQKLPKEVLEKYLDGDTEGLSEEDIKAIQVAISISLDHLKEFSDYYTRLDKLEQEATAAKKAKEGTAGEEEVKKEEVNPNPPVNTEESRKVNEDEDGKFHYWLVEYDQAGLGVMDYLGLMTEDEAKAKADEENEDKMTTGGYDVLDKAALETLKKQIEDALAEAK